MWGELCECRQVWDLNIYILSRFAAFHALPREANLDVLFLDYREVPKQETKTWNTDSLKSIRYLKSEVKY